MGHPLNPTLLNHVSRLLRPDFARTVAARRVAAGILVLLAAVAALLPASDQQQRKVVVAAHDLSSGESLSAADLTLRSQPAVSVPDGAISNIEDLIGATLAGPSRRGEVLTDSRVLGSRLTALSAGPDARVVPIHLADSAVADLIRPGDVVDVLGAAAGDSDARPRLVAGDAVVVLVSTASTALGANNDRVVLVALPTPAANAVAGATLTQSVTLTIH